MLNGPTLFEAQLKQPYWLQVLQVGSQVKASQFSRPVSFFMLGHSQLLANIRSPRQARQLSLLPAQVVHLWLQA
jgi:hypothetical protein